MSYPVVIGIEFLTALAAFDVSFILVGMAIRKLLFSSTDRRLATDLILGFLAAPMLIAASCAVTRQPLWVGLVGLDIAALVVIVLPRRGRSDAYFSEKPEPLILPLDVSARHMLVFFALAVLVNMPYVLGVLAIPSAGGRVDIEPDIFDLQPAIGVTTSLTAYGFPPRHHSAESVPLLYYTGFYVMPAAVAGLAPSLVAAAIVAQYVFGSLVYLLVGWQLACRHIASKLWRVAALFLCLSGTTIGVFTWKWTPHLEGTFLQPLIQPSYNHDTIVQLLLWTPRHAIPAMLALLVLEAFASIKPGPALLRSIFFPVVFLFSSSIFVGLWLTPAALVGLALTLLTQRRSDGPRLSVAACFVFAVLAGLALLPHYYTTLIAITHSGAPTGRLTTALVAPPVLGHVLTSCGLGLIVSLPLCFFNGRRGLLWAVYLLTLLGAILTSTFNSDFMCKGTTTLMVFVAFLTSVALYQLWKAQTTGGLWLRPLCVTVVLMVALCSLQSLVAGLMGPASLIPQTFSYRHLISRSEFELVRWVRENTKADQTVSLIQDDRTVYEPLFGRPALAAGPGAFYNGQAIWADSYFLKKHLDENSDLCSGILRSDYVYLSRMPMGFGDPKLLDHHFDQHRLLIESLGLTIVKENEAGLIARNPKRTAEEIRALRSKWDLASQSNGYHSEIAQERDAVKWVLIDLGQRVAIDEIRLVPARPTDFPDTPGFGFPVRFRVEVADDPSFGNPRIVADETNADFPNPGDSIYRIVLQKEVGRCVRVTATSLWNRDKEYLFALAELEVVSQGQNITKHAMVSALDSIEAGRWASSYLVDGYDSRHLLPDYCDFNAAR
jgi:hypothetical protein